MSSSTYIAIIIMWIIIIYVLLRNRQTVIARKIIKNRKTKGNNEMKELATDGAILLEKDGKTEAINLDFVICIREYPRNKKGKKKSMADIALGE